MKSTIQISEEEQKAAVVRWQEPEWEQMVAGLPEDLDQLAQEQGAIQRKRKVRGATNLLRMVLAYAVCDWSLRLVGTWATIQQIACVSDVALLYRFRQCGPWLGRLIGRVLEARDSALEILSGVRVRLVDATVISRPGSQGTDWRIHLSFDLGRMCLDGVEVTDAKGGESLARFAPRADEIYVADRGYAFGRSMGAIFKTLARLVIRINWQSVPVKTELGHRLDLIGWLKGLTRTCEQVVVLTTPEGTFRVRLIAAPLPSQQAQRARDKLVKQARKKGKTLHPNTWLAAGFVILLTNLPAETWEVSRVLYLYRLRWQIEVHIKRLKSLLQFDHLRAQDARLAQTYLLAKVLAALWLDQLVQQAEEQAPQLFQSLQRPVSLWRLHALFWIGLRNLIVGSLSLVRILQALPLLHRFLCDPPRTRLQNLAWSRRFLARLSNV